MVNLHPFNPFKPGVLFMGHWQTVQNQIKIPQNVASDQVLHYLRTECTF